MRQLIVKQLDYDLTPVAGLALVGHHLERLAPVFKRLDQAVPVRNGVVNSDILRAYLGLLTVEPSLQASGLGRRLLAAAETEAVARFAARRMEMTVIHRRAELIAWYERRGYRPTGETRPFPVDPPRPELDFVVLEKGL